MALLAGTTTATLYTSPRDGYTASGSSAPSSLNITALTAVNKSSVLECWSLTPGFSTSAQPGTTGAATVGIGALGSSTDNSTFSVLPAQFNGGQHNAPAKQYVSY